MLSSLRIMKAVQFNFARKVRNVTLAKVEEESKQIDEQFEPLTNLANFQLKIKSEVVKSLSYEGEDPTPHKLVNRPAKGAVWGLGGQLVAASKKMQLQGVRDDVEQIAQFLELHQVKNIYIHDWKANDERDMNRRRYSILGSCFSARHCWKTAIELKNAFNKNILRQAGHKKIDPITALMIGQKDDEWSIVEYKQFEVSLMTEEQRQAADLEWKWNNQVPEEVVERHARMDADKKRRRNQFQDFD